MESEVVGNLWHIIMIEYVTVFCGLFNHLRNSYYIIHAYHQTSSIRRTAVGSIIVDHSDVVGASPVGAAPTTSSFSA